MTPQKRKAQCELSFADKHAISGNSVIRQPSTTLLEQLASDASDMVLAEQYDEAILLTANATIKMIEIQATIWERKANISQELQSALMIIKLDTKNTSAYLRAGNLYSIQGKQEVAVATFEQGQEADVNEEMRALFQERIDAAKARLERRVDFISQCPPEIVSNIASYLDMDAVVDICMNVSHAWYTTFLNCPTAWESVHMLDDDNTTKIPGDLLATVSRHVKNLEVIYSTSKGWDNMLLITACTFSNLRSLSITGHRYHQRPFANLDILYQLLENVSPTLIELDVIHWSPRVSVERALSICRNLTVLKFNLGSVREYYGGMSPLSHTTKLIKVEIYLNCMDVSSDIFSTLEPLFQQSPDLRYLHVDPMNSPQSGIFIVAQHCPNLAVISASDISLLLLMKEASISPSDFDACHGTGLRLLALDNINSVHPLGSYLAKSCHTLQALYITTNYDRSVLADWEHLSSFVMHKLTFLHIDHKVVQEVFCSRLGPMIRCFPALEIFKLSSDDSRMLPEEAATGLFDALAKLNNLSTLQLTGIGIHKQALMRLLQHHSEKQYSTLHTLKFSDCPGMAASVIQEAARIRSLIDLTIYCRNQRLDETSFTEFARLIAQLPRLQNLRLRYMTMTDDSVCNIAACTSLRLLSLEAMDGLTLKGRELLNQNIKQVVARK